MKIKIDSSMDQVRDSSPHTPWGDVCCYSQNEKP